MKYNAILYAVVALIIILTISLTGCERINQTRKTVSGFTETIKSSNELNSLLEKKEEIDEISEEEVEDLVKIGKYAVENAKKIDHDLLNNIYPQLGDKFEENLIAGIDLIIKGYEEKNKELAAEGQELIESWGEWLDENIEKIKPLSFLRKDD